MVLPAAAAIHSDVRQSARPCDKRVVPEPDNYFMRLHASCCGLTKHKFDHLNFFVDIVVPRESFNSGDGADLIGGTVVFR